MLETSPRQYVKQLPTKLAPAPAPGNEADVRRRRNQTPPRRGRVPHIAEATVDTGNTAWLLTSSALVLLMIPGLALFYGGLNRSKSVLNMMMMSFSCIGLVSVLWLLYGFSLAFGTNSSAGANNIIGSFTQYLGHKEFISEI